MFYPTLKLINQWFAPAGARGQISILIFHRVMQHADPLFPDVPDAHRFRQILKKLRRLYHVLPLADAVQKLQQGSLPARAAVITFDDGYADNATVALPILQAMQLPATFFVSPGFLNGGRMWNDTLYETVRRLPTGRWDTSLLEVEQLTSIEIASENESISRRAIANQLITAVKHLPPGERLRRVNRFAQIAAQLPNDLMMTDAQVRALQQAGMEVGAHTMQHPILAKTEDAQARSEIVESKRYLENLLQAPVKLFAYPNGKPDQDYLQRHTRMVQEAGFDAAVSTAWGVAHAGSDLFQLPRFTPWDDDLRRFMLRLTFNQRLRDAAVCKIA